MKRRDFLKLPAKLAAIWGVTKSGIKKLPEEKSVSIPGLRGFWPMSGVRLSEEVDKSVES